jgi:DNA adenine methylase
MKYMGSKNRIAKYLLPIILKDRKPDQWYVEPFVGGANMIDKVEGNRIGSDSNHYLMAFLESLQGGFEAPKNIDLQLYDHIRDNKEIYKDQVVGCVGFCFTYAAKWFGGFIGNSKDVVCVGRDRLGESYRSVEKARVQVFDVNLFSCNYWELEIPDESIIYCDPPYANTTKYKDDFNHPVFWQWCRDMSDKGHQVFISEYNAPDDFKCLWQKEIQSGLNTNSTKKGIEKLFKYNP